MDILNRHAVLISFLLGVCLLLAGCGEEKTGTANPYFRQGISLRQQNEMEKAVEAFHKCLRLSPAVEEAHFQLGTIYEDHLDEPIKALYHYSMFIAGMTDEAENTAVATQSLERLKRRLFTQWSDHYPDIIHARANTSELETRIRHLQQSRDNLIEQTRELMAAIRNQREQINALREPRPEIPDSP